MASPTDRGAEFLRLFLQHQRRVYALILALLPNGPDADDILQETSAVLWQKFGEFERPVLIAWAKEDRVFPVRDAVRLSETFPNARLELIEDSYTFVPEDQPARLASLIASFIREPALVGAEPS